VYLPLFSHRHPIDVWMFPKNTFSPMVRGKKVPVFHDIVYFEKNIGFREFNYFDNLHHRIMIPINGRMSDINLAVSEFTASRMHELLGIPMGRISVIKEGVEPTLRQMRDSKRLMSVQKKHSISIPFFFYAGSLSPRKNMLNVLRAFNHIKHKIPHNIYYTGGYSWRDNEVLQYIKENDLHARVIKLGFVPDEDLIALYNLADCYLYPSLYEGFGLPILEAQACGCPVITSTVSSCPEVAGDCAIFVDPTNVAEIASAMIEITANKRMKKKIMRFGLENVKKYSWEQCASEILSMFERLYRNN